MNSLTAKGLTTQQLKMRIFDVEVDIWTDSQNYVKSFVHMYPRFVVDKSVTPASRVLEFIVLTNPNNPWGKPVIIVDGEVRLLTTPKMQEEYIYEIILDEIIPKVSSHFLIHAGVITHNGRALVIMADTMHGKTTTVLELVRRGFKFLSDEIAALGLKDGRVHPFPRSVRIRQGTLEKIGLTQLLQDAPNYNGRLILDIETIWPGSMGQIADLSHIVILKGPANFQESKTNNELIIGVDRLDDALITAINQIREISNVRTDIVQGYPALKLQTPHKYAAFSQIETICREQQVILIGAIGGREPASPTFNQPACLKEITKSQTVMHMMRYCLGGSQSLSLQNEFNGNTAGMFLELASLISQANCYKMSVGPLGQMADLMCDLLDR